MRVGQRRLVADGECRQHTGDCRVLHTRLDGVAPVLASALDEGAGLVVQLARFVAGAKEKGVREKDAAVIFELVDKFAGYGFNKSHSTAYALIAYMTAYLKAHYPVEFMAALLCGDTDKRNFKRKDPLVEHMEDCRRMEIDVLPPDTGLIIADGYGAEIIRPAPESRLAGARRKAVTLRFAHAAAGRLHTLWDPDGGPGTGTS